MATYGEIQDRVNNDHLNRTDLTAETARSIRAAIRHYERQPYWFNQSSTALATVSSQSHIARPAAFFRIDELRFFYDTSASYKLSLVTISELDEMRAGAQTHGDPTHWAENGELLELFPIPNAVDTVIARGYQQFAVLSATSDTNGWTSAAEDLIVFHATKLMWSTVLRNNENALMFAQLEKSALDDLRMSNELRVLKAIKASD